MSGPVRTEVEMRRYLTHFSKGVIIGIPCPVAKRLLSEGEWFTGRTSSAECQVTLAWCKKMRPQAGECFYNSQLFCLANDEYAYFEGFYFIGGFPMPHAWIVSSHGRVVDFTVEVVLRNAKRDKTEYDDRQPLYRGVHVVTDLLRLRWDRSLRKPNPIRSPYLFASGST